MYNHLFQLKNQIHHSKHLQRAWNKYSVENFKFTVLEYIENKDKLIEREQYWLDYYKAYNINFGYNIRSIAESNIGKTLSEETKQKIGIASKGHKLSEESKKKLSNSLKGKTGIKLRKKVVQLDKEGNLIKTWDSISSVEEGGFNDSSISQCCRRNIEMSYGYFWFYYDDYIKDNFKLPIINRNINKSILQFDLDGNLIKEWVNSNECKENGYNSKAVLACCNGRTKTHNNFIWLFKDNYDNKLNIFIYKKKIEKRAIKKSALSDILLQFDLHGNLINEWISIKEVNQTLGYKNLRVIDIENNKITSNGFIWIYKQNYLNNINKYNKYFKPLILQFNLDGIFIKEWDTAKDITRELNINGRCVTQCCNNKNGVNSAYGYLWKYKTEHEDYMVDNNKNVKIVREIMQYEAIDDELVLIKTWDSVLQASKTLKIDRNGLIKSLKNNEKYKSYYWKYKEVS